MYNVLYVEDDENSRTVMQLAQRIHPDQFQVTIFEDSSNFQKRLNKLDPQPELILLDIHVNPYTGFDMLKMIRANPLYDNIPVVACTASVMNEEIAVLKDSGFQGVLSKPLDMEELPNLIEKIMNGNKVWYVW